MAVSAMNKRHIGTCHQVNINYSPADPLQSSIDPLCRYVLTIVPGASCPRPFFCCVWAPSAVVSISSSTGAVAVSCLFYAVVLLARIALANVYPERTLLAAASPHLFSEFCPCHRVCRWDLSPGFLQASPLRPTLIALHIPIPTTMPSMARFGRVKKTLKPEAENANSDALASPTSDPPPRSPRVSLPHVETQLNMHRYNGLFEPDSPERQKDPAIMESATGQ